MDAGINMGPVQWLNINIRQLWILILTLGLEEK